MVTRSFVLCFCFVFCVFGRDFYVSLSGNAASTDCSETDPCQSIQQAANISALVAAPSINFILGSGIYTGLNNINIVIPQVPSSVRPWNQTQAGQNHSVVIAGDGNPFGYYIFMAVYDDLQIQDIEIRDFPGYAITATGDTSSNSSPSITITDSQVSANLYAIIATNFEFTATNSEFNSLSVKNNNQSVSLRNCSFTSSASGFTITTTSDLDITECQFIGSGTFSITLGDDSTLSLTNSIFMDSTESKSSSISINGGKTTIDDCIFQTIVPTDTAIHSYGHSEFSAENVNITGLYSTGMYTYSSISTIDNCMIEANQDCITSGAGVLNTQNTLLSNCASNSILFYDDIFVSNITFNRTGSITFNGQDHELTGRVVDCEFLDLQSSAMILGGTNWTIENIIFNSGPQDGNPGETVLDMFHFDNSYNDFSASLYMTNCSFYGSEVFGAIGGNYIRAMYVNSVQDLKINKCTFENNRALTDTGYKIGGGAIYVGNSAAIISDCVFNNNSSPYSGGAIEFNASNGTISSCSFVDNFAADFGSSISFDSSYATEDYSYTVESCSFSGSPQHDIIYLGGDTNQILTVSDLTFAYDEDQVIIECVDTNDESSTFEPTLSVVLSDSDTVTVNGSTISEDNIKGCEVDGLSSSNWYIWAGVTVLVLVVISVIVIVGVLLWRKKSKKQEESESLIN